MLRWIIRKLALYFIRSSMNHSRANDRNIIFRTIMVSLQKEFDQENFATTFYSLIVWLLKNDPTFIKHAFKSGAQFEMEMEVLVGQAVATAFQDIVYLSKQK